MAATYTSAANVRALLQIDSASTTPSTAEIEAFINRAEDYIDQYTGHAWRTVSVANEFRDIPPRASYENYAGIPIYLRHRSVKTLAAGSGDKIEVWEGSSYVDYVATKTENRNNDFWLDYNQGILYLRSGTAAGTRRVRATYRYGETSVPKDIEEAATKLAAIDMASADDRVALIPKSGSPQASLTDKVGSWTKRIYQILDSRKEPMVVSL